MKLEKYAILVIFKKKSLGANLIGANKMNQIDFILDCIEATGVDDLKEKIHQRIEQETQISLITHDLVQTHYKKFEPDQVRIKRIEGLK